MTKRTFWWFTMPSVAIMVTLMVFPLVTTIWLGFQRLLLRDLRNPEWIGLGNYRDVLGDPEFWSAFWFTMLFIVITVPIQMLFGLAVALLLDRVTRGRSIYMAALLLPFIVPLIVSGLGLMLIFGWLRWLGQLWPVGLAACIINLPFMIWAVAASVNNLDPDLEDAASSCGAPPLTAFATATLPAVMPGVITGALLMFILIVGPTAFLLKTSLNGVGVMAQNFIRMNFWTEPFSDTGFVESWTIFYWAWWIAFAPYVGLFVTRISRGRSIRQVIAGMLIWGSLGSWLFYMVMGNYALFLELSGSVDFTGIMRNVNGSAAIVAMLEQLPLATIVIGLFSLIAIIFSATTYDSASYTLASSATLHLKAGDDPARWHRVFWAFALGLMPVALMLLKGNLRPIQVILLIVSLPILFVGIAMSVSLVQSLREDHRQAS